MNRILVIDDEPSVRLLLTHAFRDVVEVRSAATAHEGLALFELDHFDAVYVDLNLPDMPGDEVMAKLKALRPSVPLVILTADPEHCVPGRGLAAAYLNKPFKLAALEQSLRSVLRGGGPAAQCV